MFWDQLAFGFFLGCYLMLSVCRTFNNYRSLSKKENAITKNFNQVIPLNDMQRENSIKNDKPKLENNSKYIKALINYSVSFNNRYYFISFVNKM